MSSGKRIGILLLAPVVGAVLFFVFSSLQIHGVFSGWESLGKPPEKAVKILAIAHGLWVQTESGRVYRSEIVATCTENCWVLASSPEPDPPSFFPVDTCGILPSLDHSIDTKATCEAWGPGSSLYVYSIRDDGYVFVRNHRISEGDSMRYVFSPCIGAAVGFILGVFILLVSSDPKPPPQPI